MTQALLLPRVVFDVSGGVSLSVGFVTADQRADLEARLSAFGFTVTRTEDDRLVVFLPAMRDIELVIRAWARAQWPSQWLGKLEGEQA